MKNALILIVSQYLMSTCLFSETLEEKLKERVVLIDYSKEFGGGYFGVANEENPFLIKEHLDKIEQPGWLLSCGTERSVIALALCEKCTGLVGVDVDYRIKAYNDFNVMLLRLSQNREQYLQLRGVKPEGGLDLTDEQLERIAEDDIDTRFKQRESLYLFANNEHLVRQLLAQSDVDETIKNYYLDNFEAFAQIFYGTEEDLGFSSFFENWGFFKHANYLFDDQLFSRVHEFAKTGRMVFIQSGIDEVAFGNDDVVSAIDTSNIWNYFSFQFEKNNYLLQQKPRIIWTTGGKDIGGWDYFSYVLENTTADESRLALLQKFQDTWTNDLASAVREWNRLHALLVQHLNRFEVGPNNCSPNHFSLAQTYLEEEQAALVKKVRVQ